MPASQATIPPARTTVPQNAGATVVNRRGFMIPSPPKAHLSHAAQPSTRRVDFSDQDMAAQWRKPQVIIFSRKCCPNAPRRRQAVCCVNYSPTATPSLGRSSGHHHRRGTPHGERHDPNGVGSTARSASARRRTWARRACCYFGVSTSNRFLISAVGRSIPDLSAGNRKVRSTPAGSTGRRNTGAKSLCWGFKLQSLTWSFI